MFSHTDKKEDTLESGGILKLEWVGWGACLHMYHCMLLSSSCLHISSLAFLFVFKSAPFAVLSSITSLSNGKTS